MAKVSKPTLTGSRIPKACQECRKRKIRCNGLAPCPSCQHRNTLCVYRDKPRHVKKKKGIANLPPLEWRNPRTRRTQSIPFARSLLSQPQLLMSATDTVSPSSQTQLYFGPTSHFALMQLVYRDVVSNSTIHHGLSDESQEPSARLDSISIHRNLFGTPDTHEASKTSGLGDLSSISLPYELANMYADYNLQSNGPFLTGRQVFVALSVDPLLPKAFFEQCLKQLYSPSPSIHSKLLDQSILLIALAIGSLGTEYFAWGDVLLERVKTSLIAFDDTFNLQIIQILTLMISHTNISCPSNADTALLNTPTFKMSKGDQTAHSCILGLLLGRPSRPGSTRICLTMTHKTRRLLKSAESHSGRFFYTKRTATIYFYPSLGADFDLQYIAIEYPKDPLVCVLATLCKTMSRSVNKIYGQRHPSLLHMWRVACSIFEDLRRHRADLKRTMGFEIDSAILSGARGVQQTMVTTLYYDTLLLTFRPFLIIRNLWRNDMKLSLHVGRKSNRREEVPSWLNEACDYALNASQKIIHHLCHASRFNDLVKQTRYYGYILGSSTFTLIYDFLHDADSAPSQLPWVHAALQNLSSMRVGEPINSTISAIQAVLRNINPLYEWAPGPKIGTKYSVVPEGRLTVPKTPATINSQQLMGGNIPLSSSPSQFRKLSGLSRSQWKSPHLEGPTTSELGGSAENLLDVTQTDMGWNFDSLITEFEAFFSKYQSTDVSIF
ncbi:hypothetical protein N7520_000040 [Penicillium odoratum]|uniref:uncharacterized protein n=1 Tax=Penicillium odoratum TaxID=1167516 RepID=UPI00254837FD|nr:uncharacterized protein N7520_000040 [Penicillium odoratum]KAJ5776794.1 hypothetical protein N7520_000040 [Penicillium odoratum]